MRSRTSRGVPEWFGGKELYIGSAVSAIGRVSGVTGIVPGPPEGSRGSTGWGHLSRRAPWAEVGRGTSPWWAGAPPLGPPAPRVGNPRVGGASTCLGGQASPLATAPPRRSHLLGPEPPPHGAYIKGGGRAAVPQVLARPSPLLHLFLSQKLGEALLRSLRIHHRAVVLLDLHQPLLPPC